MALTQCIFQVKTPDKEMSFSPSVLHVFLVPVSTIIIIDPSIIRFMGGLVSERVSEWVGGPLLLLYLNNAAEGENNIKYASSYPMN